MFIQTPYRSGQIFGFWYAFPKRGDGIPMHQHTPETEHNIIVLKGSVLVYGEKGPSGWRCELTEGGVMDLMNEQHEIVATEDGTLILNLNLRGMPEAYRDLHASALTAVVKRQLQFPLEGDGDGDCVQGRGDGG